MNVDDNFEGREGKGKKRNETMMLKLALQWWCSLCLFLLGRAPTYAFVVPPCGASSRFAGSFETANESACSICRLNTIRFMTSMTNGEDSSHGMSNSKQEKDDEVIEPTVMIKEYTSDGNSNDNEDDTGTPEFSKEQQDAIFGATAAMAKKTHTPFDQTLEHVQSALMDFEVIDTEGVPMKADDIASIVQGHRVALYFGAGWCPACRELEFMLPQYMKALQESEQPISLIYVSSDMSQDFQLDRMKKLGLKMSVPDKIAKELKQKFTVWSGRESSDFDGDRRSGIPSFVVLDNIDGKELKHLDAEQESIAVLSDWDLDDPVGIF